MRLPLLLLVSGLIGSQALSQTQAPPDKGQKAPAPQTTFAQTLAQAEKGDAESQYLVGSMYRQGQQVNRSLELAALWFRKAAEQGHVGAQTGLGATLAAMGGASNEAEAIKWYHKAAEKGDQFAQSNLGIRYSTGGGVPKNLIEARKWFTKSAEAGNPYAQCALGHMYYAGNGVEQDFAEALKWFRKSAEQGYSGGQYHMGLLYTKGQGVEQNFKDAVYWYRLAAEQDEKPFRPAGAQADMWDDGFIAFAQNNLGVRYSKGEGVPVNFEESAKWFRKSALRGHVDGQINIAWMYREGKGVETNLVEAYAWFSVATKTHPPAAANQEYIARHLDPKQLLAGYRRTKELFAEIEAQKRKR